jgi:hypothetical protein
MGIAQGHSDIGVGQIQSPLDLFVFRGWVVLRKTDEFGCVLHSRRRPFKGTPPQHDRRRENV